MGDKLKPDWSHVVGRELYDHLGDMGDDFNAFENKNIVNEDVQTADTLHAALHAQFNNDG